MYPGPPGLRRKRCQAAALNLGRWVRPMGRVDDCGTYLLHREVVAMKFELPPPLPDDLTLQRRRREKRQSGGATGHTPKLGRDTNGSVSTGHPPEPHPDPTSPPGDLPPVDDRPPPPSSNFAGGAAISPPSRKSRHHGFLLVGVGILIIVYSLWWLNNHGSISRSQAPNSSPDTPSAPALGNASQAAPNATSSPTSSPNSQEDSAGTATQSAPPAPIPSATASPSPAPELPQAVTPQPTPIVQRGAMIYEVVNIKSGDYLNVHSRAGSTY